MGVGNRFYHDGIVTYNILMVTYFDSDSMEGFFTQETGAKFLMKFIWTQHAAPLWIIKGNGGLEIGFVTKES